MSDANELEDSSADILEAIADMEPYGSVAVLENEFI